MLDCDSCQSYKTSLKSGKPLVCHNQDWFPPYQIRFCRPQVIFFLKDADTFRSGEWLQCPNGSSYIDPEVKSNSAKIPSHKAEEFASEIDARLYGWYRIIDGKEVKVICPGIEGKLLEYEVQDGRQLSDTSWKALNYISGRRRKLQNYPQWKAEQNRIKRKGLSATTGRKPSSPRVSQ